MFYVEHGWDERVHEYSHEIHLLLQLHMHTCFNIHKDIRTYVDTCVMLTTATCCLCVLQASLQQPIERLDPVLDRINGGISTTVSGDKCVSSRERQCCYTCVHSYPGPDLSSLEDCSELKNLAYTNWHSCEWGQGPSEVGKCFMLWVG